MHDLDTALLRTFITLAETRSFTRTADRIHRSQSTASMQIARLEELLGRRLFQRTKRSVQLTADGEHLLGYARNIVSQTDDLIDQFSAPEMDGEVRLGSPEDFASAYLPEILGSFARLHPRVSLSVNCDLTLTLIKDFELDQYDLIVIKQDPNDIYSGARPLWRERLVWVGPPSLDGGENFKRTVNRLCGAGSPLPLVLSPSPCVYRKRALEALGHAGIPWKAVFTSQSFAGAVAAVRSGLGVTVFPRNLIPANLVPLENERGWPKLKDAEICLLARPKLTAAAKALAAQVSSRIAFNNTI